MNFARTAWQNFKDARCRAGFHGRFTRERVLVPHNTTVDTGGDWPQEHVETQWLPSTRVRMTCRNCGHHYFMHDVASEP